MRSPTSAEFAILTLLGEGPRHGYEIEKLIEQRGLREWTEIGFSSIYFLLDKLRRSGLVEPLPGEGGAKSRRPYRLTGEGERTLARETLRTLAEPERDYPRLLLGLANWPAVGAADGIGALSARSTALDEEVLRVLGELELQPLGPQALGQLVGLVAFLLPEFFRQQCLEIVAHSTKLLPPSTAMTWPVT